jgi:adenylate cyclase
VRGDAAGKLDLAFEDMGQQQLKNIARPVRVYALRLEGVADPLRSSMPASPLPSSPAAAPRLSIVVLPFANLGSDPEQQYFADGITEDLTTDLSRIAGMLVISRNTAFTYQGKRVETRQIGRELGVRYVLEGSVRRSGNRVRVNAQLIDAETDAHLWAERFDRNTDDLFALQDEVTGRIAIALNLELVSAEAARSADHPDALDFILRGRALSSTPPTTENYAEAIRLYECALTLDPQSVEAQALLAKALAARAMDGLTNSAEADITHAERLVWEALAVSPRSPLAHYARGQVLRAQGRCEDAIPEYETALASNRNWVEALANIGRCKFLIGSIEEAIAAQEQAIRLSPRDPQLGIWYLRIGQAHLLQSRIDEAILWFDKARTANPRLPFVRAFLASAYALKGETKRASAELAEARGLSGGGRFLSIAHSKTVFDFGVPKVRALYEATYFAGLRKAGMPEE